MASWRKSWKPASSIFITTTALPGSGAAVPVHRLARQRHLDGRHRADRGACDPHLLAGDQEAAVVEDRPDLVLVPVPARRLAEDGQRGRGQERGYGGDPPHGPGGTSEGSHFGFGAWPPVSRSPSSVNGLEPGIGWVVAARAAGEEAELEVVELLAGRDRRELAGRVRAAGGGALRIGVARLAVGGTGSPARWKRARSGRWRRSRRSPRRTWRGSPSGRACRAGRTRSPAGRRRGRRSSAGPPCSPCARSSAPRAASR